MTTPEQTTPQLTGEALADFVAVAVKTAEDYANLHTAHQALLDKVAADQQATKVAAEGVLERLIQKGLVTKAASETILRQLESPVTLLADWERRWISVSETSNDAEKTAAVKPPSIGRVVADTAVDTGKPTRSPGVIGARTDEQRRRRAEILN